MRPLWEGRLRRGLGALAAAVALLAVPVVALAQAGGSVSGFLVRVQGDLYLDAFESADLVMVVSGDAEVHGRAGAVVVVGGTARLVDARVGRLVVVRGVAELDGTTRVIGDVWLMSARVVQSGPAAIGGSVQQGLGSPGWRWVTGEAVLALGVLGLMLLVGWVAVAVAAGPMRRAAEALTGDLPGSLGAALLLFVVAPAVAVLLFFTVLGLPLSFTYLVVFLPLLALAGFAVSALRLGVWILRSDSGRPDWAVLLGGVVLAGVGLVPFVGQILVPAACALGAGALARVAGEAGAGEAGGVTRRGGD
jgi:hypothetical protein